ncbi:MAG: flagellar hook-associated protein FlgL [Thiohalorhabdaceae bacterium]
MVARVSNQMMLDTIQGDLRRTNQQFFEAQRRAATGKRVIDPSDDPTAKQTLMTNRDQLQSLETFDRNTSAARTKFRAAESALGEATDVVQRARELAVKAASDSNTTSDREAIQGEAEQLMDQLVQVANQRLGGKSLFAGNATNDPAVQVAETADGNFRFSYPGNSGQIEYRIDEGQRLAFDQAIKRPDSALRTALDAMATLVEGFRAETSGSERYSFLQASEGATDATVAMGDPASGLNTEAFNDINGDGVVDTNDAGNFRVQVYDDDGNAVSTNDLTIDPANDPLNDTDDDPTTGGANGDLVDRIDAIDRLSATTDAEGRLEVEAEEGYSFAITQDETNLQGVLGLDTSVPQVKSSLTKMDDAVEALADARGELGAKMNRLDLASERREGLRVDLETLQSELGDADIMKAYSELTQRRQTLQGAMQSSLMLQRTTILNHL